MESDKIEYFEKPFSLSKIKLEHIRFRKKNQANCERYMAKANYKGSELEISDVILI